MHIFFKSPYVILQEGSDIFCYYLHLREPLESFLSGLTKRNTKRKKQQCNLRTSMNITLNESDAVKIKTSGYFTDSSSRERF